MRSRFIGAALAIAVVGAFSLTPALTATASAAPVVTLKARAVPIPGFPRTGNFLGAGAAIEAEYTISGTEYGGFPLPLTEVSFYLPPGVKLHPQGFKTCSSATIQERGPEGCPRGSAAGPAGEALGVVSFGVERVREKVTVQPFFAPGGGLTFSVSGSSPVSIEFISQGKITNSSSSFGPKLVTQIPLIETVPGAADASTLSIKVKVGAAYKQGKKTVYYGTVPKSCPRGGFPVKSTLTFMGGETSSASYKAPCPKR